MSDTYEEPQDFPLAFPEFPELPTSRPFASFTELYAFVQAFGYENGFGLVKQSM
ncbi:hypothetical protein E4U58_000273, partial [Claviceps cyperi]